MLTRTRKAVYIGLVLSVAVIFLRGNFNILNLSKKDNSNNDFTQVLNSLILSGFKEAIQEEHNRKEIINNTVFNNIDNSE